MSIESDLAAFKREVYKRKPFVYPRKDPDEAFEEMETIINNLLRWMLEIDDTIERILKAERARGAK